MMTVRDVARRLNCSLSTVYQLIETAKLGAFHIGVNGGGIRVSEEQLNAFLKEREHRKKPGDSPGLVPMPQSSLPQLQS